MKIMFTQAKLIVQKAQNLSSFTNTMLLTIKIHKNLAAIGFHKTTFIALTAKYTYAHINNIIKFSITSL